MLRVEDGQIVENNAYTNGAEIAQQLGLLPRRGSTADRAMTGAFNAKTAAAGAIRKSPRALTQSSTSGDRARTVGFPAGATRPAPAEPLRCLGLVVRATRR